jgi:hypothetical protein
VRRACVSDMACIRARGGGLGEDKRAAGNGCREGLTTKREITLTGWYKRSKEGKEAAAEEDLAHAGGTCSVRGVVRAREVSDSSESAPWSSAAGRCGEEAGAPTPEEHPRLRPRDDYHLCCYLLTIHTHLFCIHFLR